MKTVKCPVCGEETTITVKREETFRGMLEDIDGYSCGIFKCPRCGLTYKTCLYPEGSPENLMIEDIENKLDFLTGEMNQKQDKGETDRKVGLLLRLKIGKEKGIQDVSLHDVIDYLGPIA